MRRTRAVTCPTCQGPSSLQPANPWRPFCSERCRLVDLGGWLDERYAIAGEPAPPPSRDRHLDDEPEPS